MRKYLAHAKIIAHRFIADSDSCWFHFELADGELVSVDGEYCIEPDYETEDKRFQDALVVDGTGYDVVLYTSMPIVACADTLVKCAELLLAHHMGMNTA